ncbi:unnamed protein product [Cuscuta campestris]|uniref:Uncharacterized protein n=1 Tax=Cuscuta campestris TaxID=132261 RepID=A0A484LLP6_9ASTE|nr:unnamed protein product [Cuscuta campestris]
MEQPDSRSVDAKVRKDTEDDVILHPVATIPETLYLEHTVTQQEENMQSKKKEDLQSEKEIPEIVDEEPLLACLDVPFEDVQFTTPASKKTMAKRTGSRWSLRQKAKENQESEGIEEIQTKEVKKKELKRKEKATDDQEESSKKQKTSSPSAKLTTRRRHYNDMATREEQKIAPAVLQPNFSKTAFIKGEIQSLQEKIDKYKTLIKEAEIKKKKWAIILSSLDTTPDEAAKSQGEETKQGGPDDAATQGEQSEDDEATEEGEESADAEDDNLATGESDFEAELHKFDD